jgi:hypothetical protein
MRKVYYTTPVLFLLCLVVEFRKVVNLHLGWLNLELKFMKCIKTPHWKLVSDVSMRLFRRLFQLIYIAFSCIS